MNSLKRFDTEALETWWKTGIVFPYFSYNGQINNLQFCPYLPFPLKVKYMLLNGIKTIIYNEKLLKIHPTGDLLCICEGVIDTLSMLSKGLPAVGIPGIGTFQNE